jgi:hypothetical protein
MGSLLGYFLSVISENHHLRSLARLSPFVKRELLQPLLLTSSSIHPSPSILDLPLSKSASHGVRFLAYWIPSNGGVSVKQGYRLIIVDKDGVLVSEFQLTENALAQPEASVAALKQSIDDIIEEGEP